MTYKIDIYKGIATHDYDKYVTPKGKCLSASRRGFLVNRANEVLVDLIKNDALPKDIVRMGCYIRLLLDSTKKPYDIDFARKELNIDRIEKLRESMKKAKTMRKA